MECTQRLEFTQELYDIRSERVCPEQIGFLGICGDKHPIKRGPNKIGRDPQTCNIVINMNSVSRQHAVINILNQREFMLMDLDSANKTKLMDKTLQPYIPHPLKNGDMVQFGDIFGVFRLLEEDNDLPMTQAIDIPETPISTRHVSKLNKVPVTTIPESPDVSDRDDSFIAPSQPKREKCFTNSNNHFIKPSSSVIAIQPVGTNKIDNVYWSSAKRSVSLNSHLDDSNNVSKDLDISDKNINGSIHDLETQQMETNDKYVTNQGKNDNIHNMETQNPFSNVKSTIEQKNYDIHDFETQPPFLAQKSIKRESAYGNIHNLETQAPFAKDESRNQGKQNIHEMETQVLSSNDPNDSVDSIYTANTQIPPSPPIHSLATQLIVPNKEHLPEVCKIVTQHEMQFNLFTAKNNDDDIFHADTQPFCAEIERNAESKKDNVKELSEESKGQKVDASKVNMSDEEILFEDIDNENFEFPLNSQPIILPSENLHKTVSLTSQKLSITKMLSEKNYKVNTGNVKPTLEVHSDSSTDCEDIAILPTQKITTIQDDDDLTDCEDLFEEMPKNSDQIKSEISNKCDVGFEDMLTQKIDEDVSEETFKESIQNDDEIADMPTQVITVKNEEAIDGNKNNFQKVICIEDLPTQVIEEDNLNETLTKQDICSSNVRHRDINSPFKIPLISPIKIKRKDIKRIMPKSKVIQDNIVSIDVPDDIDGENNYYAATQDILKDLCSQQDQLETSQGTKHEKNESGSKDSQSDDELVPCSVEDYDLTANRFPHLENSISPKKSLRTSEPNDRDDKIGKLVQHMTIQQIKDVIGIEPICDKVRRVPSDPSDVEVTPKKVRPIKFMDIDLPDSQEIKTSVSLHPKTSITDTSSESEQDSEEQCTPILYRKKIKSKSNAKVDLIKKFDVETLPTRVITRVRKPTSKYLINDDDTKKLATNILKSNFLTEQEDDIDKDIITENISRLKSKMSKQKDKGISKKSNKAKDEKTLGKENESKPEKTENKVDKQKADNSKTVKDNRDAVKSELKVNKTTKTEIDNVETAGAKTKTSKNDKSIGKENESKPEKTENKVDKQKADNSKTVKDNRDAVKSELKVNKTTKTEIDNVETAGAKTKTSKNDKSIGKENESKPEKTENKVDKQKTDNSKTVKDSRDAIKSELKISKTTKTEIDNVETAGGKTKTSKNDKSTKPELKRKSNDEVTKVSKRLSDKEVESNLNKDETIEKGSSKRSTRSTRNRRKEDTKQETIINEEKTHKEPKVKANVRKPPNKNCIEIDLTEETETEVRRSKRQRTSKEKKDDKSLEKVEKLPKSILKKDKNVQHEQSAVYSVSSESGADSPSGLKRSATSDLDPPSPKRTRANIGANNISLRSTPARINRTQYVLFTAFPSEEVRAKLEKLGAVIVSDVAACTMVLTLQIKRTFKLLCAVGLGRPIVGAPWVQACADSNMIVDPWLYLLNDEVAEKRFQFTLERVLQSKRNFLRGYNVSSTPNVLPTAAEMKLIVECSGGVWKEGGEQWICVSCAADKALWPLMKKRGAIVVSTEFILGGVLRQRLDIASNRL